MLPPKTAAKKRSHMTIPPTAFFHRFATNKYLRISLSVLVVITVLFGLLGYFWLPGYAKAKLETALSEVMHRPVTVQSIDVQPFTLEMTVRGFRVGEKTEGSDAGNVLFSIDELYANLSIASIVHRAPVISSISLKAPAFRLIREGDNRFNISDLIEEFMKRPDDGSKTMFSVSNIVLEGGRFEFVDRLKQSQQEVSEIRIGVPFIANFEGYEEILVEPHFSAKVNGAPLALNGKLHPFSNKREATIGLKLNDIDLTRIDEYSPIPVGINLLSGYFETDLLLAFTQETGKSPNMILSGSVSLRKLELENQAVETPYTVKLDQLDIKLTEINLNGQKPSHAALTLADTTLVRKGELEPVLSLLKLSVDEIVVDPTQQSVALGIMTLDQFKAAMRRETDGRLDLIQLFTPPSGVEMPPPAIKTEISKPWTAKVGSLKLVSAALRFEDRTLTKIAPMVVDPLDMNIDNIDLNGALPLKLALRATVNQHGSLETNGSLGWAPVAVDLAIDAKDIDLVALQGWAGDRLNALLTRGAASFRGKIKVGGEPLKVAVNGEGRFTNFNVLDKINAMDLLRWRSLDIGGIEYVSEPLRVNVASIAIADFFAQVIISPEGRLNLNDIFRNGDSVAPPTEIALVAPSLAVQETTATASIPHAATALSKPPTAERGMPVRIGRVVLQGGNIDFSDRFIKPNYRVNLTGLAGRIGPLDPGKLGEVDVRGAVDKTAPLEIRGRLDPFSNELFLDIAASAKGIEMPTFSPYSGKYVGYAIEKGKLSVNVRYHVEKSELKAENNVFIDQLTFGEKVESSDALSIPVNLAVALLKNRHGEIDIHLPVSGSLNDPQFRLGPIIIKVIVNLLTKAVTAPFALLGSLFGGEELSAINFSSGHARTEPEAEKRLQALSTALIDRPGLKLEITGYADPANDRDGLKREVLDRKIKAQKLSESAKKGEAGGSLDAVELKPEEYSRYLTLAYNGEKFTKPKNVIGLTKSLPVPEMEQLMLANINAGDDEMLQLAERRARAAYNWLIERGSIPGDRVFVLEPKIEAETEAKSKKSGSRVEFSLR